MASSSTSEGTTIMSISHKPQGLDSKTSFSQRAFHGFAALLAQNLVARGIGLGSQLILARLLLPRDFGLIGLTYTVTGIVALISNFGVDDVLVHKFSRFSELRGTALWISFGLGLVAGMCVMAIAPVAALAFHAPQIVGLLAFPASAMPIGALASVPNAWLRSKMRFGTLSLTTTAEFVASTALTLLLAWRGYGAYSFMIPMPMISLARVLTYWLLTRLKSDLSFDLHLWAALFKTSSINSLNRLCSGLIGQGDYLVLGLFASKASVGFYYFAFRLAAQPFWMLANNFTNVVLPVLVRLKDSPERQRDVVLRASRMLNAALMPVAVIEAGVARPILHVLFGHKWDRSVIALQLLSLGLAFDATSWIAAGLCNSRGEYSHVFKFLARSTPLFFILVTIGAVAFRENGVATAVMFYYIVSQPPFVIATFRKIGITARQTLMLYLSPFIAAAAPTALAVLGTDALFSRSTDILKVALVSGVGAVSYMFLVRLTMPDIWNEGIARLTSILRLRRRLEV